MLNKFWETIGSNVAERWLEYIFGPAFLFWVGGLGLYFWQTGWKTVLQEAQVLSPSQQGSGIILALLILISSSVVMQALRFPILRLLEGYWPWPLSYLAGVIVTLRKPYYQKKSTELHRLASRDPKQLSTRQHETLLQLDRWAHWHPVTANDLLPTSLGNILRSRERSPERKYGMDAIVCWPRLWPLLPEHVRAGPGECPLLS